MATERDEQQGGRGEQELAAASTGELVGRLAEEGKELVKKEVALAKAELREEWKDEIRMALGFVVGGIGAFLTVELLLAALVLALAESMSGGAAALVAAGVAFAIGALTAFVGWKMRAKTLLGRTRKTLKEDAQWVQQQLS